MSDPLLRHPAADDGRQEHADSPVVHRARYRPYSHAIDLLDLCFELALPMTRVTARIDFRRVGGEPEPLVLNAEGPKLVELRLDGKLLPTAAYRLTTRELIIQNPPAHGQLQIVAEVSPGGAGSEGLICLDDVFVTHCEPEGFRRIMFFPDRPDVLARYRCTLIADADRYPTLLSNGHLTERGVLPGGRHYARWEDPFVKASYLFALVAGKLAETRRGFITRSGRAVELNVHCIKDNVPFCEVGIATLMQAIQWDEEVYGREYDLDVLNVAVLRNYPGGGMENKGLNLYSAEFFLAAPEISTDDELRRVQAVIAHEYFHNWTGNRVGSRSWFELSLKEGFTIFRQQQFMATLCGDTDARIDDILRLQELQYPEDEGGMAHAVRPETYVSASNLYTKTVYEKGAEIIRMLHLLVGAESFRAAADEFFNRFDGVAATIDDLLDTIAQVSGRDLSMFRHWYSLIGSVTLTLKTHYDARRQRYSISFTQAARDASMVLEIPLQISLLGKDGKPIPTQNPGKQAANPGHAIVLTTSERTVLFESVAERPTPLLRGFSAPVRLATDLGIVDLTLLARNESDLVARWSAAQSLAELALTELALSDDDSTEATLGWLEAMQDALQDRHLNPAIAARLLQLPSERRLGERSACVDVEGLHAARIALARMGGEILRTGLRETYARVFEQARNPGHDGARRLRNTCLWYLMQSPSDECVAMCWEQLRSEQLLENSWNALRCLVDCGGADRRLALAEAHARWRHYPALLDHWFSAQAASQCDDCADMVAALVAHPDLALDNSARLKATFDTFADNQHAFHAACGAGYDAVLHVVHALNGSNPRLAARFLRRLDGWTRFDEKRCAAITQRFRDVLSWSGLAPQLREIATKSLHADNRITRQQMGSQQ